MKISEAQAIIDQHYQWGLLTAHEVGKYSDAMRNTYFNSDGVIDGYKHRRSNKSRAQFMAEYFGAESITI